MSRYYIDAEELLAWYDDFRKHEREVLSENYYHKERKDEARIKISTLDKVYFKVQELKDKTVDVEKVRHGEWEMIPPPKVYEDGAYVRFRCSECGTEYGSSGRYCPNCGARMDGKEKNDDEL